MAQKRKISVTLDEDLVSALEGEDGGLSAQVNEAVRLEVARRARHQLLAEWLNELETSEGPVDEQLIAMFDGLLA